MQENISLQKTQFHQAYFNNQHVNEVPFLKHTCTYLMTSTEIN